MCWDNRTYTAAVGKNTSILEIIFAIYIFGFFQ